MIDTILDWLFRLFDGAGVRRKRKSRLREELDELPRRKRPQ